MARSLQGTDGSPFVPSRRRRASAALALALSLAAPLASQPSDARFADTRYGYLRAGTISEVVNLWHPETHLYLIGDVGLDAAALRDLAASLADTHWTVLLVQDARGQTYPDLTGRLCYDDEAIEHAINEGIPQRYGFAEQVHPLTKESDGAVFSIVLAQGILFYTSSEAQDRRGLGKDQFRGNLDRWAIEVTPSGGGIAAAVKDTVTQISTRFETAIGQESASPKDWIEEAAMQLDAVERLSSELRRRSPGALRNLRLPALAHLRAEVEAARQARDAGNVRDAWRRLSYVLDHTGSAIQALEALRQSLDMARSELQGAMASVAGLEKAAAGLRQAFPGLHGLLVRPDVETLRQDLAAAEADMENDPSRTARTAARVASEARMQMESIAGYSKAVEALNAAAARLVGLEQRERSAAARGQLLLARQRLAAARRLHAQGMPGYAAKLRDARTALEIAERRISRAELWLALRVATIVSLLLFATVVGFVLNQRRRGVKGEAEQLLADWRAALDRELQVLLEELEQRAGQLVGSPGGKDERRYAGETLRLAEQIHADVGSLRVLWTSASGVLQEAEALIRARGLGAACNFFFPDRYRQGIELLRHEPAQEIAAEINLRAGRATEALDLFEWSVICGPAALDEAEQRIHGTEARRRAIEFAGFADELFLVPAVFTKALPAAAAALARARSLFDADPIGVLQNDGTTASRIALEASQLTEMVVAAREGVLVAIDAGAATLRQASIATGWIEAERSRLSERADRLAAQAADATVADGIEALARDLADLGSRVERAVAMSKEPSKTVVPS